MKTETTPVLALDDIYLSVEDTAGGETPILRGISLELSAGEVLGLVGESGSGKSMTARVMAGIPPRRSRVRGRVLFAGEDLLAASPSRRRQVSAESMAMVFQDPRAHLDPVRPIGDYLTQELTQLHGVARSEAELLAVQTMDDVGVSKPQARLHQYPHELSGGLLQRVMIAAALMSKPAVLLADEPTTALDVTTQSELMHILREQQRHRGMSLLFITHDLDLAAAVSDRVAVMYAGEIVESGPPSILESSPRHPYTAALLTARPNARLDRGRLTQLDGTPISAGEAGSGCAFRSRCPRAITACEDTHPVLTTSGESAWRCLRVDEAEGLGAER